MEYPTARITIRIKPSVKALLLALAEREFREPSQQAGLFIEEALQLRGLLPPAPPLDPVQADQPTNPTRRRAA